MQFSKSTLDFELDFIEKRLVRVLVSHGQVSAERGWLSGFDSVRIKVQTQPSSIAWLVWWVKNHS